MAKPRVFVSSTYYDLKYVRERLERFIKSYNMDPVLFEYDKVYYNPSGTPTSSCYKEIEGCHLMVLIIGGRYGSLDKDNERESYDNGYVSITQNEYRTAIEKGVPTMVFIDRNVYAEYKTYQNNKVNIPADFKFAFVDDVKIFEFISTLGKGAIKDFDKVEDIEHYFAHQISGMLYDYLVGLQDNHEKERIKTAVDEIKVVSQSMKDMINSIAEKILGKDQGKYKDLIRKQNESLIDFFMELVDQNISIKKNGHLFKDQEIEDCAKGICEIFYSTIFNTESISIIDDSNNFAERYKSLEELQQKCAYLVKQNYSDIDFNIYLFRLRKPMIQIFDMVRSDEQLKDYFEDSLYVIINTNLSLPF